ncbi:MAG: LysM peptidoglycan-binding domain-containing protein [Thermoanaerobacteraceae bacterium]|nr:LysM peptidoglycan-binding domain-containing protein [Thermoanaerobacteraceae bacterium]
MSVKFPSQTIPHKITPGDTLYSLAKHHNTTVGAIFSANPGIDPNFLQVGQNIYIPVFKPVAIAKSP